MQKKPRMVPSNEFLQHVLGLASWALDIHLLQDRQYILEEKLGIPDATACGFRVVGSFRVEETEDAKLSAYESASTGL